MIKSMKKNILYLTDEYLYLYNKKMNKMVKCTMPKGVIINGYVANINKFITKFEGILKEYNLNNGFIGDKIRIIVHPKYTAANITLLKNIFEKFNYRNISIENEVKYYKLNDKNAWINANNKYLILTYINEFKRVETKFIEGDFFSDMDSLFHYLKTQIHEKELFLIGTGSIYDAILSSFEEKYKNKTYTFKESEFYLLQNLVNL